MATQATSLHCFSTRSISDLLCPSQALPHKCFPCVRLQIAARLDASHYIVLAMPISASSSCCSKKYHHGSPRGDASQTIAGAAPNLQALARGSAWTATPDGSRSRSVDHDTPRQVKTCSAPPHPPWDRVQAATHTCSHSAIALASRVSVDEIILKRQAHSQKARPSASPQPSLDRWRRGLDATRTPSRSRACARRLRGRGACEPGASFLVWVCSDLVDEARAHAGAGHCASADGLIFPASAPCLS